VILDIGEVTVEEIGTDRVRVSGARGKPPPPTLKATVCVDAGWLGEAEISYAGPNALARAELAASVVRSRCRTIGIADPVRVEVLGTQAIFDSDAQARRARLSPAPDGEYRVRAAVRTSSRKLAQKVADEVLSLYCSGPAAGAGVRQHVTSQVATASVVVDRARVHPIVSLVEAT
ncbi:MAG TPA: acyclic terpene utilization AtuA family protein, partial [Burkholderiales bacterium]|nr:acyclic terpene utilization AtuA family protein [Burkholderiales bacterium]